MRAAFLCYLTQAWTADRYPKAQRDAPAPAASRASHSRPSPRAPGGVAVCRTSDGGCRVTSCVLARE